MTLRIQLTDNFNKCNYYIFNYFSYYIKYLKLNRAGFIPCLHEAFRGGLACLNSALMTQAVE